MKRKILSCLLAVLFGLSLGGIDTKKANAGEVALVAGGITLGAATSYGAMWTWLAVGWMQAFKQVAEEAQHVLGTDDYTAMTPDLQNVIEQIQIAAWDESSIDLTDKQAIEVLVEVNLKAKIEAEKEMEF